MHSVVYLSPYQESLARTGIMGIISTAQSQLGREFSARADMTGNSYSAPSRNNRQKERGLRKTFVLLSPLSCKNTVKPLDITHLDAFVQSSSGISAAALGELFGVTVKNNTVDSHDGSPLCDMTRAAKRSPRGFTFSLKSIPRKSTVFIVIF